MASEYKANLTTGFNAGELTPALAGRVDFDDYKFGARFIENLIPEVQGGLKKFYGTRHVATLQNPTAVLFVPWHGLPDPVVLVFHDGTISVVAANSYYDTGIQTSINDTSKLSWVQNNDTMFFAHPDSWPFFVQYFGIDSDKRQYVFKAGRHEFTDVPYFPLGWAGNYNKTLTTTEYDGSKGLIEVKAYDQVGGLLTLPDKLKNIVSARNITAESGSSSDVLSAGTNLVAKNVTHGDTVIDILRKRGEEVSIVKSISIGTVKKDSTGVPETASVSAGTASVVSSSSRISTVPIRPGGGGGGTPVAGIYVVQYKVVDNSQILSAVNSVFSGSSWQNGDIFVSAKPTGHEVGDQYAIRFRQGESNSEGVEDKEVVYEQTGAVWHMRNHYDGYESTGEFSAIDQAQTEFEDTNVVGRKIKFYINQTSAAIYSWTEGEEITTIGEVRYSDNSYYRAMNTGTCGKVQPTHRSGIREDGHVSWQYMHSGSATATVVSVIDSKRLLVAVDGDGFLPYVAGSSPYEWVNYQWSMWGYRGKYPSQVFFYKNRLCYICPTDGYGCYFQASKTDDYLNFSTETYGQNLDTDAINLLVSGHSDNNVNWVLPGTHLYCGSYMGEYNITGADRVTFTPTGVHTMAISTLGGAPVRPAKFKELNLFVGARKNELNTIAYDYTIDDYVPTNIGFSSTHLLDEGVARLEPLNNEDRNIYFTTEEKNLRALNYVRELKHVGFVRLNLDGDVLDAAATQSGADAFIYFFVKRGDVYTIECAESDYPQYMLSRRTIEKAEDGAVKEVTIPEFANKTVWVKDWLTGQFLKQDVGADGVVKNVKGWNNWLVGLPMQCTFHGQPMSGEKLEGLQQKVSGFTIRLKDTGAFEYGSSHDFNAWSKYNNWNTVAGQAYDTAHKLITGDIRLPLPNGYMNNMNQGDGKYPNTTGVALNLRSDTPEPLNLLMISNVYV